MTNKKKNNVVYNDVNLNVRYTDYKTLKVELQKKLEIDISKYLIEYKNEDNIWFVLGDEDDLQDISDRTKMRVVIKEQGRSKRKPCIVPKIKIHNDSVKISDQLNRSIYAKAIAQEIKNAQTPITIGILAKWGSGKSQLLLLIEKELKEKKLEETEKKKNSCLTWLLRLLFVVLIGAACFAAAFVVDPCSIIFCKSNSTGGNQTYNVTTEPYDFTKGLFRYLPIGFLILLIFLISLAVFCKHCGKCVKKPWIFFFSAFTKTRQSEEEPTNKNDGSTSNTKDNRYILVKFNAWEYAGSDNLWAAIVTNLATKIEEEFGVVITRLFQLVSFKTKEIKNSEQTSQLQPQSYCDFVNHCFDFPKTRCRCSIAGCWILLIVFVIALIISAVAAIINFKLNIKEHSQEYFIIIQVVAWAPTFVGLLYVIVKFLLAACQSQTSRINKALKGTKKNMAEKLGFMHKVKQEVKLMMEIMRCAGFVFNRKYTVVISIDDLDRVDLKKVKLVLDAVNILLSDNNSPFICLIAVDSRIAAESIEENTSKSLVRNNVTGHEYLKKIINLPFCLPEIIVEGKKQFIHGLLAWNDKKNEANQNENEEEISSSSTSLRSSSNNHPSNSALNQNNPETNENTDQLRIKHFIEKCQKFLYNDQTTLSYLDGNPRNIKRIFNILSLTLRIIQNMDNQTRRGSIGRESVYDVDQNNYEQSSDNLVSFKTIKKMSFQLVTWVILTDQWPYSMSYILHVIEKSDDNSESNIEDDLHLFDIYEDHVKEDLLKLAAECNRDGALSTKTLMQDRNQDDFPKYLKQLKEKKKNKLNKKEVKEVLKKITFNLDQSYLQIARNNSNLVTVIQNIPKLNKESNLCSSEQSFFSAWC